LGFCGETSARISAVSNSAKMSLPSRFQNMKNALDDWNAMFALNDKDTQQQPQPPESDDDLEIVDDVPPPPPPPQDESESESKQWISRNSRKTTWNNVRHHSDGSVTVINLKRRDLSLIGTKTKKKKNAPSSVSGRGKNKRRRKSDGDAKVDLFEGVVVFAVVSQFLPKSQLKIIEERIFQFGGKCVGIDVIAEATHIVMSPHTDLTTIEKYHEVGISFSKEGC
jgi:hypothetical protein